MSYQYIHQRIGDQGTLTLQDITRIDLEHMFNTHSNKMMFLLGLSIKSKLDRFVKKIGREESTKRLGQVILDFGGITQDGTTHIYHFSGVVKHHRSVYKVIFQLTTVAESSKVRLIKGQFFRD